MCPQTIGTTIVVLQACKTCMCFSKHAGVANLVAPHLCLSTDTAMFIPVVHPQFPHESEAQSVLLCVCHARVVPRTKAMRVWAYPICQKLVAEGMQVHRQNMIQEVSGPGAHRGGQPSLSYPLITLPSCTVCQCGERRRPSYCHGVWHRHAAIHYHCALLPSGVSTNDRLCWRVSSTGM